MSCCYAVMLISIICRTVVDLSDVIIGCGSFFIYKTRREKRKMKEKISKVVAGVVNTEDWKSILDLIETPPDNKMGDYAIPCFSLAKLMHKNPSLIANEVKENLEDAKEELGLSSVEAVNGYCNLFVNREKYVEMILNTLEKDNLGVEKVGLDKTICID